MYKDFEFSVGNAKRLKIKHIIALVTSILMLIVVLVANIFVLYKFYDTPDGTVKIVVKTSRYIFRMMSVYVFDALSILTVLSAIMMNIKDCLTKYTDKNGKPLVSLKARYGDIIYTSGKTVVEMSDIYEVKNLINSYIIKGDIKVEHNGKIKHKMSYNVPKVFKSMGELCNTCDKKNGVNK